jgi:hypothetical protein
MANKKDDEMYDADLDGLEGGAVDEDVDGELMEDEEEDEASSPEEELE